MTSPQPSSTYRFVRPESLKLDGQLSGLYWEGKSLSQLYPGWQTVSRHRVCNTMEVVLLKEERTGREACWWVTPYGHYQASHALTLSAPQCAHLLDSLAPYLGPLTTYTLSATPDDQTAERLEAAAPLAQHLQALPRTALLELLTLWTERILPGTLVMAPEGLLGESEAENPAHEDEEEAPFSPARLRTLLNLPRPVTDEALTLSPFTGLPLRAQAVMNFPEGTAARYCDPSDDLVFYLFWPALGGPSLLYYPKGPLLIGEGSLTRMLAPLLLAWFISHPEVGPRLKDALPFRLEDFGVGQTARLWEDDAPQNATEAHFPSSPHWEEWFKNVATESGPGTPSEEPHSKDQDSSSNETEHGQAE